MTKPPHRARLALGRALFHLRKQAGLSGRDVTVPTGIDQSSISRIEAGIIRPTYEVFSRLLDLYLPNARDQKERAWIEVLWEAAWMDPASRHIPAALGLDYASDKAPSLQAGAQAAREAAALLDQVANGAEQADLHQVEEQLALAHAAIHAARADRHRQRTTE